MQKKILIKKNNFSLLPQKAIYWEEKHILFAADIHLGKASGFRVRGIPVPNGSTESNLIRLSILLNELNPKKLILLGDLFHSKNKFSGNLIEEIKIWREGFPRTEFILTSGNHDKNFRGIISSLKIDLYEKSLIIDEFAFTHHPETIPNKYVFSGHVHPAVKLKEFRNHSVKLPAFYFTEVQALLPAFGEFTGTYLIKPAEGDKIFVIADDEVVEITLSF